MFRYERVNALVLILVFSFVILLYTRWAKKGKPLFIRKIAGLDAVEEAVGRATEMGKPVLFIQACRKSTRSKPSPAFRSLAASPKSLPNTKPRLVVPVRYPMVLAAGQEVVEQAYTEMGRRDSYNKDIVRYVAGEQFAFTATVNGMMMRDRPAANIYMGAFFAESLLLAETGNAAGSIQIAGTARPEQLPFFVAACDYTLMGEELYAASAYLSHEPLMLGGLKGQDLMKVLIIIAILTGVILVSFNYGEDFHPRLWSCIEVHENYRTYCHRLPFRPRDDRVLLLQSGPNVLGQIESEVLVWVTIVGGFTLLLGVVSITRVNFRAVRTRREGCSTTHDAPVDFHHGHSGHAACKLVAAVW